MSTLKATLPGHLAQIGTQTSTAKKPLVVGPNTLLSIFLTWISFLAGAFLLGMNGI
jgi:hypothetical protein